MEVYIVVLHCVHFYLGDVDQNRGVFDSEEKANEHSMELEKRIKQDEDLSESYCSVEKWEMNIPYDERS